MAEPVKIFLSYAHADGEGVGRIYQRLLLSGFKPWLDREDILGGEEWERAIRNGIRQADFFLLCMSPQSITRRGVLQKEIKTALDIAEEKLETDIFLIPVWIQAGTPLPKDEMPDRLSKLQWIDLSDQDGWLKLTKSIDHQLRRVGREGPRTATTMTTASPSADSAGDAESLESRVKASLQAGDAPGVEAAVHAMVDALARRDHAFTTQQASRVVNQLWRKHLVNVTRLLCDAFIRGGLDVPPVRRAYAEALLAERWLTASLDEVATAEQSLNADSTERGFVADVQGRIQTAVYLDAARSAPSEAADHLWKAVRTYHDIYLSDPRRHLFHGARAAALALHADRAGLPRTSSIVPLDIAAHVRNEIRDSEEFGRPIDLEECEAALHAALTVPKQDEASVWLQRYITHPQADVANLRTLRGQLSEIWQLEAHTAPGNALLPPLTERLRTLSSPWVPVAMTAAAERESGDAERFLQGPFRDPFRTKVWYEQGLLCAQHIARLETRGGKGIATGFLLLGRELHASFPDEPLLLTNAYVVTSDQTVKDQYAFSVPGPEDVRAHFLADDLVSDVQVVWSSFDAGTTILRLAIPIPPDRHLKIAKRFPRRQHGEAYIIGHPGGRDVEFSLDDALILDHDDRVVHYRTPTEGGSSGSPVFDDSWQVIAIHYAGGDAMPRLHGFPGAYQANEGIRLDFIRKVVESDTTARG